MQQKTLSKDAEKLEHPAVKGMRSTILGIIINALLAITKGIAGVLGNTYALIADAIESSSDVLTSIVVLMGLKIAAKPADKGHPYGHGKAEPIAAAIVALSLFGAAVLIAVQSIREIYTPHHTPAPFTLIVLVIVVITKEVLFRYVFKVGKEVESRAVKTDAWHHRSDAITSAAAFIGISVALIGGKGLENADDWAALFSSFIIAFNAYRLLVPTLGEIMDIAPPVRIERQIRRIAGSVNGVQAVEKCYVRKMGFEFYVDLHVMVDESLSVKVGHKIAHDVRRAVREANPRISNVLVHIEPYKKLKDKL